METFFFTKYLSYSYCLMKVKYINGNFTLKFQRIYFAIFRTTVVLFVHLISKL